MNMCCMGPEDTVCCQGAPASVRRSYGPAMATFASMTFRDFLDQTSAKTPTPGGGAVASAVGALAGALGGMVVSYSIGKKSLAAHEPVLRDAAAVLANARTLMLALAEEDAQAYGLVNELMRLPESDPRRMAEEPAAILASARVPLAAMAASVDLLRLFGALAPVTNRQLRSDLGIAAVLAEAACRSSEWNVRVNVALIKDAGAKSSIEHDASRMLAESVRLCRAVEAACA